MLSSQTVQVHNIETQSLIQSLTVETKNPPKFMVQAIYPVDIQYTSPTRVTFESEQLKNMFEFEKPINRSEDKIIDLTMSNNQILLNGRTDEFMNESDHQNHSSDKNTVLPESQRAEQNESLSHHKDSSSPTNSSQKSGAIHVIIGTSTEIIGLLMVPLHTQLLELFQLNEIEEALVLLSQIEPTNPSLDSITRQIFYNRGGFYFLTKLDYESSLLNFRKGSFPPQYLISLFFCSTKIQSNSSVVDDAILQYIQEIKSITQIISKKYPDQPKQMAKQLQNARNFLVSYLLDFDSSELIDTTLLKLYTLLNQQQNLLHLVALPNLCNLHQAEEILQDKKYVLSILYNQRGEYAKTLDIWIKILNGEILSSEFRLEQIIELLIQLNDKAAVLKYARMVLNRDCVRGVNIFTARTDDIFTPTEVLEFLELWKTGKRVYLETIKCDAYSTDLLELYLNDIEILDDGYMINELGFID